MIYTAMTKAERNRERECNRAQHPGVLRFMGQDFASVADLKAEFPAFASDDCLRAMRSGCEDVVAVETYCWQHRNAAYLRAVAAARKSPHAAKHRLGGASSAARRVTAGKRKRK